MDKLICEHCGAELTIEKKFCSECGSSNPHYVEPPMDIEENLPETLQDLFEWYQMKFGYNTYVKVNIRQNKAEPNSYCIFGYKDKFTAYQYGPTGDSLTRIVLYDGPSEKEAVRTLCKKLETIYDEFRKNGYKKNINYTEEKNKTQPRLRVAFWLKSALQYAVARILGATRNLKLCNSVAF